MGGWAADKRYKLLRSVIEALLMDQGCDARIVLFENAEAWQRGIE